MCVEFLGGVSRWQRGAAALGALVACGLFAPAALATGSPEPPAAPLPVAAAVGAEVAAVASPEDAQAPADTATASPADAQAPADSATPPATSATDQSGDS